MNEKEKQEAMEACGYRKGFDWQTRFDLKSIVKYENEEYEISTVDLGLDHSFGGDTPLYYETMIFLKGETLEERTRKENPFEYFQERYATEEKAKIRHYEIIEEFAKGEFNAHRGD